MIKLGDRLKDARQAQGFSLEEVSEHLKIRPEFLKAVEEGNYGALPSRTYAQGFVRNYINFLDLPERDTMAVFRREFTEKEFGSILPTHATRERSLASRFRIGPLTIIGILFVIGLVVFSLFQFRAYIFDPSLSVSQPKESTVLHTGVTTVQGTTNPGVTVSINGEPALVGKTGNFSQEVSLFTGEQTIIITARNDYGKSSTVLRHVKVD